MLKEREEDRSHCNGSSITSSSPTYGLEPIDDSHRNDLQSHMALLHDIADLEIFFLSLLGMDVKKFG